MGLSTGNCLDRLRGVHQTHNFIRHIEEAHT